MFTRILVPLDGSELACEVLPHVRALVNYTGAIPVLMRVVDDDEPGPLEDESPNPGVDQSSQGSAPATWPTAFSHEGPFNAPIGSQNDALGAAVDTARAYLQSLAAELETTGLKARTVIARGPVAEMILRAVDSEKADIIAMSTHGRGGIGRFLLGSVADRIVQHTNAPVLLVRAAHVPIEESRTRTADYRRILVPLDGSDLASSILPVVGELAAQAKAQVTLLRAMPEPEEAAANSQSQRILRSMTGSAADTGDNPELDPYTAQVERERQAAQSSLELAEDKLRAYGVIAESEVAFGKPSETILDVARSREVDLIAMATHGRSGLTRFLLGSVAERMVRYSHVPVLLSRAAGAPLAA